MARPDAVAVAPRFAPAGFAVRLFQICGAVLLTGVLAPAADAQQGTPNDLSISPSQPAGAFAATPTDTPMRTNRRRSVRPSGPASGGSCTPQAAATLAEGVDLNDVAGDETHVYYGDDKGVVRRVPRSGGTPEVLGSVAGERISGIAVDATRAYFGTVAAVGYTGNVSSLYSVPKGGGAVTTLATGLVNVLEVVVDEGYVYWNAAGTFPASGFPLADAKIQRVPKGGGAVETLAANLSGPYGLALDATHVYFGESGYAQGNPSAGIRRVAKSGGAVSALVSGISGGFVAVDEANVYFSSIFSGGIHRVPKSGGAAATLVSGRVFPVQVAVADGKVYYFVDDNAGPNGRFEVVPAAGGASTVLRSGVHGDALFEIVGCDLYFTSKDAGLQRIPR